MPGLTTKTRILKKAGYIYNFDREIYFNRKAKNAFSIEFIEDNSEKTLQGLIDKQKKEPGWSFYFNSPPSAEVARDLEKALAK